MSTPAPVPAPAPSPAPKKPIVIIPTWGAKEVMLAVAIVLGVGSLIGIPIYLAGKQFAQPHNITRGKVTGRYYTGEREDRFDVSRRGVKKDIVSTGYFLKVYVEREDRTFDVPVQKEVYDNKKDGEIMEFWRPRSEQTK